MKKVVILFFVLTIVFVAGCGNQASDSASEAAKQYILALAEKDKPRVVSLSCNEWEESAILEVDALLSVGASVSNLECKIVDQNDSQADVVCTGNLDLTYNDEVRAIDLSRKTYSLSQEDGQWRVCSYQ